VPAAQDFSATERDLLVEAAIDVIGLWWIAGAVRAELGEEPPPRSIPFSSDVGDELVELVRQSSTGPHPSPGPDNERVIRRSMEIIERFLLADFVYPSGGTVGPWYEPWPLSVEDSLLHIEREWRMLDTRPSIEDVMILVGTERGARVTLELWPEKFEGWRGAILRRRFANL
jgi:hypothetical protein